MIICLPSKRETWKIKGFVADGKDISADHWKASCIRNTLNPQKVEAKLADMELLKTFLRNTKRIPEKKFHREWILQNSRASLWLQMHQQEMQVCPKTKSWKYYELLNNYFLQATVERMSAQDSQNTSHGNKSACTESSDLSCSTPWKHFVTST